eukprot:Gb_03446 [translate_table: standard]
MAGTGSGSGAGQYLMDLPSRGYFTSTVPSSTLGGLRVYVCDHNTSPSEEQLIKTDSTNILIRSLTLKKSKADAKPKDNKGKVVAENGRGKRPAPVDEKPNAKRAKTSSAVGSSKKEGGPSQLSDRELQMYTVDTLRSLLRERGLPTKGKKEELIARLKQ